MVSFFMLPKKVNLPCATGGAPLRPEQALLTADFQQRPLFIDRKKSHAYLTCIDWEVNEVAFWNLAVEKFFSQFN